MGGYIRGILQTMITRHEHNGVTWIDLEAPTQDELHAVIQEFGIDSRVEQEIVNPTPYPLVATFPSYVYMILHFPTADLTCGTRNQEVDIIVGKEFLITVRYETIACIHSLHKAFEAEMLLDERRHTDMVSLLERALRHLYSSMREEVEEVARQLDRIEEQVFSGKEKEMVRKISEAGRVLLRFDTTLQRHQEPLDEFLLELQAPILLGKKFKTPAAHIEAERAHVAALVSSYRAAAGELRATNDALLSSSQDNVMKIFTGITVILLPLTLIAGIFGMHTEHEPIIGHPLDFWIIIGAMAVLGIFLYAYMKYKKWI